MTGFCLNILYTVQHIPLNKFCGDYERGSEDLFLKRKKMIIKRKGMVLLILCFLVVFTGGCSFDVPVYWQDRCLPLNFNTRGREFNVSWEEINERCIAS